MKPQYLHVKFGEHEIRIPYFEIVGKQPGPDIFLSAGMHGGEINGIAAVEAFLRWAERRQLQARLTGRIIALPLLNPSGFASRQRRVAEDNGDLNRAFGISEPTTFSEQIAYELTEKLLKDCEFGIDFHDASGTAALLPHARVLKDEASGATMEMGQLFGTQILIEREGKPNMMAVALNNQYQIPVLTVEIGGSQRIFPEYIHLAIRGIRNFLIAKGMAPGEVLIPERQFLLTRRFGVKEKEASMVQFSIELGDQVHYGDILGRLYYPGRMEVKEIKAPMCGIIFSLQQLNQVEAGDTLFSILETDSCHIARTTLDAYRELEALKVTKIRM